MASGMFQFMGMVAPVSDETWFTVHHRIVIEGNTEPIFPGNAHKTIKTAMNDAQYWAKKGHCVYISQGMYRQPGRSEGRIYPQADRTYPNLVACKNLYIDCDVKQKGEAYRTVAEMRTAVKGFLEWFKLMPTVIVGSGNGGWHIYWTLDTSIDQREHKNMATRLINAATEYGLLFDKNCTNDATRLLRIPDTWNFKYATSETPATPVTLDYCGKDHLDVDRMRKHLERWPATVTHGVKPEFKVVGGTDIHGLPLDENADLTGGMTRDYAPVSIDEVAKHCPFIDNTLKAGGANLEGDPQWHTVIALACHTDNPSEAARRLCEKSPYYTPEGNEQKLATAQQARANRETIGPPKCAHIAIERPECKTCPHFHLGTTPLAVGFKQPNGHRFNFSPAAIPPGTQPIDLPYPYYQGPDMLIYMTVEDDGTPNKAKPLVFEYPLLPGAMLEAGKPSYQITLNTVHGEKVVSKRFDTSIVSDNTSFVKAFSAEGLSFTVRPEMPRQFLSSYIKLLQSSKATLVDVPPFGWSQDENGDMGFSFAGEFVSPAGTRRCCRPPDGLANYNVMGDEQVWIDLMKLIITPDRPDLACMVAASFGAPLVGLTGENGLLMGVVSSASGIGKSTALLGGQSVWSTPVVGGLNDTVIFTFNKCAMLRHLPVFYDEIKGERQLKAMTEIAFQLTGGREKGRADRTGRMREVKEFKTLCGYAANGSIVEGVREEDKGTDASWLRMFEMKGIRQPDVTPNFASNVNNLLTGLALNHGGIGRKYATLLGQSHKQIYKALAGSSAQFAQQLGASPKVERFWIAAVSTTLLGAYLANSLGVVNFPLSEMQAFMFSEFHRMKGEMAADPSDYGKDVAFKGVLGSFLNEKQPRNMVILDKTWTKPTRPPKGYASILNDKPDTSWGKLEVQISGDPLMLRIADASLGEWCRRTNNPKNMLIEQMRRKLGAKLTTATIGSGSRKGGTSENAWVINAKGTIIEEDMEYTINHKLLPP